MDNQSGQEIEKQKKRSLKRYRKSVECLERLKRKLAILDDRITSVKTSNYSGMPRGGVPVTIDDLMSDKIDLEERIERLKVKSRELKRSVCDDIDSLEDPRYCEILEAFFIEGLSMRDIADNLGYTERRVFSLYSEAIKKLSISDQ